jgi:hypothetical protein
MSEETGRRSDPLGESSDPFADALRVCAILNQVPAYLVGLSALTRILHAPVPSVEHICVDDFPILLNTCATMNDLKSLLEIIA